MQASSHLLILMSNGKIVALSLCAFCLLVYLAWFVWPVVAFIAFVPFLLIISMKARPVKRVLYLGALFFLWNLVATYWLFQINFIKGSLVILVNTFLMLGALSIGLWFKSLLPAGKWGGYGLLLITWLSFEHLHYTWNLSWPWLTIGNVFSRWPALVQWYAVTGTLGGTAWVLIINYLSFQLLFRKKDLASPQALFPYRLVLVITVPIALSLYVYLQPSHNTSTTYRTGIVHTNYHDKSVVTQMDKITELKQQLSSGLDSSVNMVVIPELFLDEIFSKSFYTSPLYTTLKSLTVQHPGLKIVTGATLIEETLDGNILYSAFSQNVRVKKYNASILVDSSYHIPVKEKKILIPFEERMPPQLSFIPFDSENYSFDENNDDSFLLDSTSGFLNLICYEAVNSLFVAKQIKCTDRFIVMLASEAFFRGVPAGREQYVNICRLRAIETGKYLIKASNEGISAVIDDKGNLVRRCSSIAYKLILADVPGNSRYTFFSRCGDLIGEGAILLLLAFVLLALFSRLKRNGRPVLLRGSL